MALWDALAPAATAAQLVGADAAGIVSAILGAVRTARRNRTECRQLARRVMMVGDLLRLLPPPQDPAEEAAVTVTMRRPEVRRVLDALGGALRRARELVESCQEGGAVRGFVMAGRQAEQFRDVQSEIDSYLFVFPLISYIDITLRLDRICNVVSEEAHAASSTSHIPDARNEASPLGSFQFESNQAVIEPSEIEEHRIPGTTLPQPISCCQSQREDREDKLIYRFHGGLEELLTRDQRLKWLCWRPR